MKNEQVNIFDREAISTEDFIDLFRDRGSDKFQTPNPFI